MKNHRLLTTALLFVAAFLLCGFLRVTTTNPSVLNGFTFQVCGAMLLVWAMSVRTRVTDRRLRRLILGVVASLLLFLILQIFRGNLAWTPLLERYCWYGYYIPYLLTPLLLFLCALAAFRPADRPLPRWSRIVIAAAAALILCAVSNDLHQQMFRFPGGVFTDTDLFSAGPIFILYFICYGALLLAGFIITLRKTWKIRRGLNFLLPAVPPVLLGIWMLQNFFHCAPSYKGMMVWNQSDCFCFAYAAYLELCIQIGLIPANSGYGPLFSRIELSAAILDADGAPVRRSGGLSFPFPELEALQVSRQPVSGGSVSWAVDLSRVFSLNEQLEEAARQTEHRNELLIREGRLKKEMTELETRNRLYEQVYELIRPKLEQIESLSAGDDAEFLGNLPRISLLTAYIKRRCNMELLSGGGTLPLAELAAALTESSGCMQLCGVETAVNVRGEGELPAAVIISAYEHVHALAEEALETLKAFLVRICACDEDSLLEVRIMLKVEDLSWDFSSPVYGGSEAQPRIRVSKEGGDLVVLLRFPKGGAA